jgi:hypothetical protein
MGAGVRVDFQQCYTVNLDKQKGGRVMIRFERTAMASGVNILKAIQWSKEVTEFINKKYPQNKLQVFTGRFAPYGTIYWAADFDDLAALDRWQQAIQADQEYWALLSKAEGLFLAGRGLDIVMASV